MSGEHLITLLGVIIIRLTQSQLSILIEMNQINQEQNKDEHHKRHSNLLMAVHSYPLRANVTCITKRWLFLILYRCGHPIKSQSIDYRPYSDTCTHVMMTIIK